MSTLISKPVLLALLGVAPLACFGQRFLDSKPAANLTLLTGPGLLSPPGPRTLTETGWVFVQSDSPASAEKTAAALRNGPLTEGEIAAHAELSAAKERYDAAKAKLENLRAEKRARELKLGPNSGVLILRRTTP